MTMKIEQNSLQLLATQFAQCAISTGHLQQQCTCLFADTEMNSAEHLLLNRVCQLFDDISCRKRDNKEMFQLTESLDEVTSLIFKTQAAMIVEVTNNCEKLTYSLRDKIFDAQQAKINEKFTSAKKKLSHYRSCPTTENLEKADTTIDHLGWRVTKFIKLANYCNHIENPMNFEKIDAIVYHVKCLGKLIESQRVGSFGNLWTKLNFACKNPEVSSEDKTKFQNEFDQFLKKQLPEDTSISEIINEVTPYDDLNRFRALIHTIFSQSFEKYLKNNIPDPLSQDFYTLLHEDAFGPKDVDPKTWVLDEIPSLFGLVDTVVAKVLKNDPNYNSQQDPCEPQMQAIDSLRKKIYGLEQSAALQSCEIDRSAIKTAIKEFLDQDLCNALYAQIYYIADDKETKKVNVPYWGETHCADNLSRLYQAIENLKISVAFQYSENVS